MFTYIFAKLNLIFFAAPGDACNLSDRTFFFIDPWWKYLNGARDQLNRCVPSIDIAHHPENLWLIGLAVVDMLLRLAGFIAVVSVVVAGAQLILAEGSPEKATSARNRIINSLIGLAVAASASAAVAFLGAQIGGPDSSGLPRAQANQGTLNDIFNIVFAILGALAFLFIVVAGFRFVLSRGDPAKIAEARRQILYGALGLIVIATAGAIVNFVLNRL